MIAYPTRTVSVGATPVNIRKTPAFPNDPAAYPVTFSVLRYASGGDTLQVLGNSVFQSGTLTFGTNPLDTETIAVNGVTYTFKTTPASATDIQIGATKEATATNLAATLSQSANASIIVATYATALTGINTGNIITITYKTPGTTSYTLADSSGTAAVTRSGATLAGGDVYGDGQTITADIDFNDVDQSLARYVVASGVGPTSLAVTDYRS